MGCLDEELERPIIGIANSANELIPDTYISTGSVRR